MVLMITTVCTVKEPCPHVARIGNENQPERFGSRWWLPLKWSSEIIHKALGDGIITRWVVELTRLSLDREQT